MDARKADYRLIPPGIQDERSRAILDAFIHGANQFDFSKLLMRNSAEIPDDMLSLAIHDFSLSEFIGPDGIPVDAARRLIDQAWTLHEKQGTDEGMKLGQSLLGTTMTITHWWQENPEAAHDTQKVTVWFEGLLVDGGTIADAKHQKMVLQLIDVTKRWSQDTAVSFGVRSNVSLYMGAIGMHGARYTAALPADDLEADPVSVYVAAFGLAGGFYQASLGGQ